MVIAVDCALGPSETRGIPPPWESLLATFQVMGHIIVTEKLKHAAPDLILRQDMSLFRLLDFFQATSILRVAGTRKADITEKIVEVLK